MSSYGADAVAKTPSPNEVKPPVVAAKLTAILRELQEELSERIAKPKEKLYGWVSNQSNRHSSTVVYRRPNGSEVEVSFVSYNPTHHGTCWTDCLCIGEVTEFVRRN